MTDGPVSQGYPGACLGGGYDSIAFDEDGNGTIDYCQFDTHDEHGTQAHSHEFSFPTGFSFSG